MVWYQSLRAKFGGFHCIATTVNHDVPLLGLEFRFRCCAVRLGGVTGSIGNSLLWSLQNPLGNPSPAGILF